MDKERISKNEERLDSILESISKMEEAINEFKSNKENINYLNKYYGSKSWFKDKDDYEKEKNPDVKAGVLSEDAVWNMNESIKELMKEIKQISDKYLKSK